MMYQNAFLKRMLLVVAISVLPLANVASARGGHGSGGSSGSGGGGSSAGSSGGHSSSGTSGGHSSSGMSSGHSSTGMSAGHSSTSTNSGHAATSSKGGRSANDPVSVSRSDPVTVTQSGANSKTTPTNHTEHENMGRRVFFQHGSTGYNYQNTVPADEERRRRHQHLLFGFIPIY
jgi:hypothetical protein